MSTANIALIASGAALLYIQKDKLKNLFCVPKYVAIPSSTDEAIIMRYAPSVKDKYRQGWIEAARSVIVSERLPTDKSIIQCSGPSTTGLQATSVGTKGASAAIGLGLLGTGTLAAVSGGLLAPVSFILGGILNHHAQAVAKEQGITCPAVEATNNALDQVEVAYSKCEIRIDEYINGLKQLGQQFHNHVAPVTKDNNKQCNLGCGLIRMMNVIIEKKIVKVGGIV